MLLSIIIPAYNAGQFIEEAVVSILKQPFLDYEIIIVNDGSKDNTLEIINNLKNRYKNIKVLDQKNSGASVARNNGLKSAAGEYIYFIDADDTLVENCLKDITDVLINKKPDVLIGLYKMYNLDTNEVIIERDSLISNEMINGKDIEEVISVLNKYRLSSCPWRYFIKRQLILDNNLFFIENSFVEDAIWVPMLLTSANSFWLNDKVFYNYKIHNNSVSTTKSFKFYEDALYGCKVLYDYSLKLESNKQVLVFSYYMMLLVGVMQDYDYLKEDEKKVIDEYFESNKKSIKHASSAIKPLSMAMLVFNPKHVLLLLGRYLKRKNRLA